jgi:hypothetical protein
MMHLPNHLKTSNVFSMKHLTPCITGDDNDEMNSRVSFSQPGKTNARVIANAQLCSVELMAFAYLSGITYEVIYHF